MLPCPGLRAQLTVVALGLLVAACAGPQPTVPATPTVTAAQPAPPAATASPASDAIAAAPVLEAPPREALIAAFQRLKAAPNYSFRTTVEVTLVLGDAPPFIRKSTNVSQVQNGGLAVLTFTSSDSSGQTRTVHSVRDGDRSAVESATGTWTVRTPCAPVAADGTPLPRGQLDMFLYQAEHLQNVRREGDAIVGAVADPEPGVAYDQTPTTAVREMHYWLRDGMVVKQQLQVHVVARMPDGGKRKQDQVTTVEYSNIGTTTVVVPPAARAALGL